ncbi:hypothetical protein [Rhizobium tropici]|uniref:Uncharacterized protein n=1 Tax=Rhizobium tropici TaxID=398 RepID=A0A329YKC8_RHITR|nr:hypothetical protein [Rhizobium tropici]RAX42432.1 hypothetical protein DQ393_06225 [Rhizobium tropici]
MAALFSFTVIVFLACVAIFYATIVGYQRQEERQRRLFDATIEFARQLGVYECRDFLAVAQTGDQAELERRWPTWPEFRDAGLRGDYAWGIA